MQQNEILITGGAGFIGFHLAQELLNNGTERLTLVDNINDYYDPELKQARLDVLQNEYVGKVNFIKMDLTDADSINALFEKYKFKTVINLAAQAGVQYAKENPRLYIQSNIDGFFNVIDAARRNGCKLMVYASSSSVYGGNTSLPFKETDMCVNPLSIYASSKIANEMIAESYTNTFGLQCIGLRFFNVYGPWGRPDAVYYIWSDALRLGEAIELRNNGDMFRDMTYVGDVTKSISLLIKKAYTEQATVRRHEVYNIGNENPVRTGDLLNYLIEQLNTQPAPGAVISTPKGIEEPVMTRASTEKLSEAIGYAPSTTYPEGIEAFVEWYKRYYNYSD